ncbi:hypothetical protein FACS1894205_3780 [Alphaproteobacteria bacterium]|nr:hypothetical protein FACS1894205_3780 [Alphaproteobacteria bacterium]
MKRLAFFRADGPLASFFRALSARPVKRTRIRIRWLRRLWWRRYLYASFFRILSWVVGLALIGVGILLAPSPLPLGFIFIVAGCYVIARRSRWGRAAFRQVRRILPPFSRALNRAKTRLPRSMQIFIERSDPGV